MAILSIQSHVVFGYAGNSAAVFPMQRLGREVWAVNTVEFSNHTGYGAWQGKVLGAELVLDLVRGLAELGVLSRCEAVLSGYLGDAAAGDAVKSAVQAARSASPNALYCCDPVMGDTGKGFYVKPDIPAMFCAELIPLADIVTPNQFELEAITGIRPQSLEEAKKALDALHQKGPGVALVTSYRDMTANDSASEARISMLASDKTGLYRITTPELPLGQGLAGAGDLTASVFLSRYLETKDTRQALELAASSVYGILEASFLARREKSGPPELLIVGAQEELVKPSSHFQAVKL